MGTTKTAFQTDEGAKYIFVLVIGGYEKLITNHPDPTALFTAGEGWDGTPWSEAISGLRVQGSITQKIKPFSPQLDIGRLTFYIQNCNDEADDLAVFHRPNAGFETLLTADCDADDTTISVEDTAEFAAAPDHIFIGVENILYAAKAAESFDANDAGNSGRGQYEPFSTLPGAIYEYGRDHKLAEVGEDIHLPHLVTSEPRQWAGRYVALYAHRVVGAVIDTVANAERIFAGVIADGPLDTSEGETAFICEDARALVRDTVLGYDQFQGVVKEGIYIGDGDIFDAEGAWTVAGVFTAFSANALVGATGAAPPNQIEVGWTTIDDLKSALNGWLQAERVAVRLPGDDWAADIVTSDAGYRFHFWWKPTAGNTPQIFSIKMKRRYWEFLGWDANGTNDSYSWKSTGATSQSPVTLTSDDVPHRILQWWWTQLEWSTGTWFDNEAWLPERLKEEYVVAGQHYGLLDFSGKLAIAKYENATSFSGVTFLSGLLGSALDTGDVSSALRYGEEGEILVKQVPVICGSLFDVLMHVMCSTGVAGYNHGTYDSLPRHLGAAIPWTLLGDEFEKSVEDLAESTTINSMMVTLEKPTRLTEKLQSELFLRNAHFVLKDGKIRLGMVQTPFSELAEHTLTEANKGVDSAVRDVDRSPAETTTEFCVNVIKILFNRQLGSNVGGEKYDGDVTIKDYNSIDQIGEKVRTIKAVNTFARISTTGDTVAALVRDVVEWVLPHWSMPLRILRRSMGFSLWMGAAPGDMCKMSDEHARDRDTGIRGITNEGCVILEHAYDFGNSKRPASGRLGLIMPGWGSHGFYCPTGEVDDTENGGNFVSGYDAVAGVIKCYAHEHSEAADDADASHFVAGDLIRILQVDLDNPAAALTWQRVVDSVAGNDITLTVGLAAPAWDGAFKYRVISDEYSNAVTTQRTDSYMADTDDMRIEDLRGPYNYGDFVETDDWTAADASKLPERYAAEQYGDGVAFATGTARALAYFVNNYVSHKSARHQPYVHGNGTLAYISGPGSTTWTWTWTKFMHIQPFSRLAAWTRLLSLAVGMESTGAGNEVNARLTLSLMPPVGSSNPVSFVDPYRQLTYSTNVAGGFAVLASQEQEPVVWPWTGWGYMTLELNASAVHGSNARFYGVVEDWLQELEVV